MTWYHESCTVGHPTIAALVLLGTDGGFGILESLSAEMRPSEQWFVLLLEDWR